MTKAEADKMLNKKLSELNDRTESAKSSEEYVLLVDGMLKVYTILAGSNGFDSAFDFLPQTNIGS